jgi:hypothetical protein
MALEGPSGFEAFYFSESTVGSLTCAGSPGISYDLYALACCTGTGSNGQMIMSFAIGAFDHTTGDQVGNLFYNNAQLVDGPSFGNAGGPGDSCVGDPSYPGPGIDASAVTVALTNV